MELTLKHKIAVFSVMAAIFVCSIFLKQWLYSGSESFQPAPEETVVSSAAGPGESGENQDAGSVSAYEEEDCIIIDVEGAVTYPGIVRLEEGGRVYEAVEKAGGLLDTADTKYVNLADFVRDGSIIYIPFEGENEASSGGTGENAGAAGTSVSSGASGTGGTLVNINTADSSILVTLPGIGEAYAQAIIDYRNTSGFFQKPEDIMNVSGIGESKYEKIKDLICVY
ncbi:MAG: helix-hairpin-helix domain-containing protein [Bacillota bacterium]|nr:helix-hairpin-helix domain-containing protein [Bacillota bacterium]